jgi:hypothetical protein
LRQRTLWLVAAACRRARLTRPAFIRSSAAGLSGLIGIFLARLCLARLLSRILIRMLGLVLVAPLGLVRILLLTHVTLSFFM